MHGTCPASIKSLKAIKTAQDRLKKTQENEDKNVFMRTMAYEFCRHTDNRETQNKIEAIAKEHPDFWIPYQSFKNYILTVFLLESKIQ